MLLFLLFFAPKKRRIMSLFVLFFAPKKMDINLMIGVKVWKEVEVPHYALGLLFATVGTLE